MRTTYKMLIMEYYEKIKMTRNAAVLNKLINSRISAYHLICNSRRLKTSWNFVSPLNAVNISWPGLEVKFRWSNRFYIQMYDIIFVQSKNWKEQIISTFESSCLSTRLELVNGFKVVEIQIAYCETSKSHC